MPANCVPIDETMPPITLLDALPKKGSNVFIYPQNQPFERDKDCKEIHQARYDNCVDEFKPTCPVDQTSIPSSSSGGYFVDDELRVSPYQPPKVTR